MAVPPVDRLGVVGPMGVGGDFALPALEEVAAPAGPDGSGAGFLDELTGAIERLAGLQREATAQSQALATGRAEDVTSVVMAVERASLALQLAVQVRNRAVEAYQDLFRMQV